MASINLPSQAEEIQKSKSSNDLFWLWLALVMVLSFGIKEYRIWEFNSAKVKGIGVSYSEIITSSKMVVYEVHKNTPASQAGLQKGDIIIEANEKIIEKASDFSELMRILPAGTELHLTILRDGKKLGFLMSVAALKQKDFK